MKLKLYVGCGLISATEEFRQQVDGLKDSLREKYEILDFLGTVAGTAAEVYQHDIQTCA